MDEAGASYAAVKCCTPNMITLQVDEVIFKKPVKVKEHLRLYSKILSVGKSSLKVLVEARRVAFADKDEELVCSTRMVFVRISDEGRAIAIDEQVRVNIVKSM